MLLREADESLSSYLAEDMPKSGRVIDELGSHVALVKDLTVNESTTIIGPQKERSEKPGSPEILTRNPIADETIGPQSEHSKKPGSPTVPAGGPIADETVTRIDSQAERSPSPPSPSTSASSERSVAITLRLSLDALRDFSRAASPVEPDISGEVVALIEEPDALEAAKNLVDISNKFLVASPPPARPPAAVELGPNCALCSRTLGEIKAIRESEGLLPVSDDVILAEHVELCLAYTGADADFGDDDYSPPESVPELGLEDDTEVESIEVSENYGKDGHPTRVLPYYIRDALNTGNATLFPPLPSLDEFRQLLADPELTPEQHMAVEEALVFSMHTTQEEWHLLEQLACTKGAAAPRRARKGAKIPPRRREPFKPEDPAVYEEQKEAALYSYDNSSSKYSMRREGLRTRQKHLDPIVVPGYEYTPGVPQTMEPKLTRGRNKNEASSVRATTTPAPAHVTVSSKVPGPATAANSGRSTPAVVTGDQPVKRGPGRPRKDGLAPGSRPQAAATSAAATSSTSAPTSAQVSQSVFKISFGKQGRESMKGILSRDVSPGTSHPSTPADGPPSTANGDSIKQPADERSKVGVPRGTVAATGTGRKRGRPKKADVAALVGPPRLQLNIPTIGSSQFSSFPIANEAHGTGVSRRGSTASDNDTQRPVRGKTYKTPTSIEAPLPKPTMEEEFKAAASSNLGPRVRKRRLDDGDLTEAPTAKKSRRNEVASTSAG